MLAAGLRGLPGRAALLGRGAPSLVPSRGRKTRRDRPAKSKADRIKVPPPVDPAELLVVLDRYEQHRRVVGALRLERLRKEEIQEKARKLQSDQNRVSLREKSLKEKEMEEESRNFITLENLDQRIEECLNKTQNYNFAIDKDGRIVKRTAMR
ncbi:hypothetical protein Chor_001546 [Crotalus horridus]